MTAASLAKTGRAQVMDMRSIHASPWPHWNLLRTNTHEFHDPHGERSVRVVACERLEPGQRTFMSPEYVPRHRNIFDSIYIQVQLPLPTSEHDPADPIGGTLVYRPEGLVWEGGSGVDLSPRFTGRSEVNVFLHSNGASGEPLIHLDEIPEVLTALERSGQGEVNRARNEYVDENGAPHELMHVAWERKAGRPFPFPDPAPLGAAMRFPILAYPWCRSPEDGAVRVRPIARFGARGPAFKLVQLDHAAQIPGGSFEGHRFIAVLAGAVHYGGSTLKDLAVVFAASDDWMETMIAETPTLLWIVEWTSSTNPLAGWHSC